MKKTAQTRAINLRQLAFSWLCLLCFTAGMALTSAARAGEGHDHGDKPAAPAAGLPRFAATSDAYELVGVIDGKTITLYLDQSVSNEPVKNAQLSLELAGKAVPTKAMADGSYQAILAETLKPGVTAVSASFTAGAVTDLLAGEIDLHDAHPAAAHQGGFMGAVSSNITWIALGLAALIGSFFATKRWIRRRQA